MLLNWVPVCPGTTAASGTDWRIQRAKQLTKNLLDFRHLDGKKEEGKAQNRMLAVL